MEGTHITQNGNKTPLDLTFVSNNLSNILNWNVQNDTLGSDHFIIKIELYQSNKIFRGNIKINSWNYKKAKWSLFSNDLEIVQNNRNFDSYLEINSPGNLSRFRANLETNCNSFYFSTVLFYEVPRMTY